ncbi:MAG: hypothetical protein J0G29_04510 [Alphaproteobacteria bacterium]|nr:hypothetical protein [Alphaproteobacteria bacterium]OJV47712.1 MAG: hypothetical protein BGO28_02815 [Alphaproteobacteria bacterium 43-37]
MTKNLFLAATLCCSSSVALAEIQCLADTSTHCYADLQVNGTICNSTVVPASTAPQSTPDAAFIPAEPTSPLLPIKASDGMQAFIDVLANGKYYMFPIYDIYLAARNNGRAAMAHGTTIQTLDGPVHIAAATVQAAAQAFTLSDSVKERAAEIASSLYNMIKELKANSNADLSSIKIPNGIDRKRLINAARVFQGRVPNEAAAKVIQSTLKNPGAWDTEALGVWGPYCYIDLSIHALDFILNNDAWMEGFHNHTLRYQRRNVSDFVKHTAEISGAHRDSFFGLLQLVARYFPATSLSAADMAIVQTATTAAASEQATIEAAETTLSVSQKLVDYVSSAPVSKATLMGQVIGDTTKFVMDWFYQVTDTLQLINLVFTLRNNPTEVQQKFKMMGTVPHTIEEAFQVLSGRISFLSATRAVTRLGAEYIGIPLLKSAAKAAPATSALATGWAATTGKLLVNLHGSTFSGALTMPLATGIARWGYSKFFSDEVATVLAQATVTAGAWYVGYAPVMLAIDLGLNVATNYDAYWNGAKNITSSSVSAGYEVGSKATTIAANTASTVYSFFGGTVSSAYNWMWPSTASVNANSSKNDEL